jgi:glycosyltransferase involved in cell wall biosynthesis
VEEPRVSVVIPAFDEEAFIAEAIESVLSQTYGNVETIVVDDGSTDRTAEIASGYDEVKLVKQENGGLSNARNSGVRASSGELLAFLDSDDEMLPDRLEIQVRHLLAGPTFGCVLGSQELRVEEGAELPFWAQGTQSPMFSTRGVFDITDTPDLYPVSVLLSRELFDRIGGFDESLLKGGEDADLIMRLNEAGVEMALLKDKLVRRRVHGRNMTQDDERSKTAVFEIFKRRIDRHRAEAG